MGGASGLCSMYIPMYTYISNPNEVPLLSAFHSAQCIMYIIIQMKTEDEFKCKCVGAGPGDKKNYHVCTTCL